MLRPSGLRSSLVDGFPWKKVFAPRGTVTAHSGTCLVSLAGAGQASPAADVHRRLSSPAGSFTITARAWSAGATAR